MKRRNFVQGAAASVPFLGPGVFGAEKIKTQRKLALGYDNFAVRAMKWKAPELINYAKKRVEERISGMQKTKRTKAERNKARAVRIKKDEKFMVKAASHNITTSLEPGRREKLARA